MSTIVITDYSNHFSYQSSGKDLLDGLLIIIVN